MAHISPNNIITVNRGDHFSFTFHINLGTAMHPIYHTLTGDEKLYLGVMEYNTTFEQALVKKVFTASDSESDGSISIVFETTDTLNLLPGNYYYAIKLNQPIPVSSEEDEKDKITTLIPLTKFVIIE
jgi:hypothetical protein